MSAFIQDNPAAPNAPSAPAAPTAVRAKPGRKPRSSPPPLPAQHNTAAEGVDKLPRRVRRPFGEVMQRLAYASRPNYHRHWFNDIPGRLERAKEAGYEHVNDDRGQPVSRPVGVDEKGGALIAFLMEIPAQWRDEDMAAQQVAIRQKEQAIANGKVLDAQGERQDVFTNTAQGRRIRIDHNVR